jgi:hypothetical protein
MMICKRSCYSTSKRVIRTDERTRRGTAGPAAKDDVIEEHACVQYFPNALHVSKGPQCAAATHGYHIGIPPCVP